MPISIICDYYIHKTDLADLSSFWEKMEIFAANIAISFTFGIRELQLEQTKFPVFSLCFGKISKFPVFSLTGNYLAIFPVFPVFPVPWVPCDMPPKGRLANAHADTTPNDLVLWLFPILIYFTGPTIYCSSCWLCTWHM